MVLLLPSHMGLLTLVATIISLTTATYNTNATRQFTPEEMLSVSRRGSALPNAAGTLALYTTTQYSFKNHSNAHGLWVMNLTNNESWLYTNSSAVSDLVWLDGNTFVWFVSEKGGNTSVVVGDATTPEVEPNSAGSIPGPVSGLKLVSTGNGTWGYAFTGSAARNGSIYNPALAEKLRSAGMLYTHIFVRHWDTYVTPQKNSVWYGTLSSHNSNGTTGFSISEPVNALNGTGFESPVPVTGGTDQYAISTKGLAFIAKDLTLLKPIYTKSDVWYIPLSNFTCAPPAPQAVLTPGMEGASSALVFSPTNSSLSFVRMKDHSYESDKNRIFTVSDVTKNLNATEIHATDDGTGSWDRSPGSLVYSKDGKILYAVAEDFARTRLFSMSSDPSQAQTPALIFSEGRVSNVQWLAGNKLLVSSSSFLDNSIYSSVDPTTAASSNATSGITLLSANLGFGTKWGLSRSQIEDVYYKGYGDYMVHAFVIKPSTFKKNETYPLMFYVHGGPQGATQDAWSSGWNMMLWAEQGYVVVAFNPTGSTGFGQNLTDGIQNQWGGRPYQDLVLGWDFICSNLPYVNTSRAMAAGASYGGYMMNWIQGQPLGRNFKALFTHDGPFSTLNMASTDELWFPEHDFNGTLSQNWDNYARWDPANHTDQWSTPHLIVHSELDYRLPVSEGMATFNILQERGVESAMLIFPDENHWVLKQENSLVWHRTAFGFLNKHVGLPTPGEGNDEVVDAVLMDGEWDY
ncbi:related to secreted dipeptidyl-peptidase V precursor [Rhynchosporium graminicola]|uniref:Dipeptidyl-peptidase V n=1 Tax=Rhynchosporium graminicola TaxID=2792576 RepID=A0A1E1KA50_9HELO|nr:related to secreted dipeptidyl-peptidase V precursor [Rhynchosporium commune]